MFYRKVVAFLLGVFILMIPSPILKVYAGSNTAEAVPPSITSQAVVVMDADSGVVLYEKNGYTPYMPASTTKMMTALLAIENLKLDQMVTVGAKPPFAEGASMGFWEGEVISVSDLLYALLLHSANDAAEVLAEAISGSVEAFAELMNERAKELGCRDTNFSNPSGLTQENHKTTPYDLSLISRAVASHPELVLINGTYSHKLEATNLLPDTNRWATNKNSLLKKNNRLYYAPAIMAKTGWTPEAGFNHTAVAEKDGKRIIVTMMRAQSQQSYYEETTALFNWAFDTFSVSKVYSKGQVFKQLPLKGDTMLDLVGEDDFYYVSTSSAAKPEMELVYDDISITKDVKTGEVLGCASVLVAGKEIGRINLVASQDVTLETQAPDNPGKTTGLFGKILKWLGILLGGLLAALIVFALVMRSIKMKRKKKKRMERIYDHRRNIY
jgi:D-alanyl-D-alanine carboxypeptidase